MKVSVPKVKNSFDKRFMVKAPQSSLFLQINKSLNKSRMSPDKIDYHKQGKADIVKSDDINESEVSKKIQSQLDKIGMASPIKIYEKFINDFQTDAHAKDENDVQKRVEMKLRMKSNLLLYERKLYPKNKMFLADSSYQERNAMTSHSKYEKSESIREIEKQYTLQQQQIKDKGEMSLLASPDNDNSLEFRQTTTNRTTDYLNTDSRSVQSKKRFSKIMDSGRVSFAFVNKSHNFYQDQSSQEKDTDFTSRVQTQQNYLKRKNIIGGFKNSATEDALLSTQGDVISIVEERGQHIVEYQNDIEDYNETNDENERETRQIHFMEKNRLKQKILNDLKNENKRDSFLMTDDQVQESQSKYSSFRNQRLNKSQEGFRISHFRNLINDRRNNESVLSGVSTSHQATRRRRIDISDKKHQESIYDNQGNKRSQIAIKNFNQTNLRKLEKSKLSMVKALKSYDQEKDDERNLTDLMELRRIEKNCNRDNFFSETVLKQFKDDNTKMASFIKQCAGFTKQKIWKPDKLIISKKSQIDQSGFK
ncbi:UNKNOWN [Stylonychia lemnae]|uniref:Uncharacterized protein n=1 Tax=Stylonychia lemnae TaxID=5949 RepID=A0A078ANH5_STYLE|nr:UNKNOWN [Stylonychia lemnae]|eukprot:CDW83729.1 UNKNOWN [Stylonychia lemnae]